jgi:8-oxo-dGTP diphosphatase
MNLESRAHYPLSVDCLVFGYNEGELKMALIKRQKQPFKGMWAIPGGFLEKGETLEDAALRDLKEETGISNIYLESFGVFSELNRDPRGRVISVAFFALVNPVHFHLQAQADAEKACWFTLHELPKLAFDHEHIYAKGIQALQRAIIERPLAFELLPQEFTLTQLQMIYERILNRSIDKRNFRKRVLKVPYIQESGKTTRGGRQRPAKLYVFNPKLYSKSKFENIL